MQDNWNIHRGIYVPYFATDGGRADVSIAAVGFATNDQGYIVGSKEYCFIQRDAETPKNWTRCIFGLPMALPSPREDENGIPTRRLTPAGMIAVRDRMIRALQANFDVGVVTITDDEVTVKLQSLPKHLSATEVLLRRAVSATGFELGRFGSGKFCNRDSRGANWYGQFKDLTVAISCVGTAKKPSLYLDFMRIDEDVFEGVSPQ